MSSSGFARVGWQHKIEIQCQARPEPLSSEQPFEGQFHPAEHGKQFGKSGMLCEGHVLGLIRFEFWTRQSICKCRFDSKRDGLSSGDLEHDRRSTMRVRNLVCVIEVCRQLHKAAFGWRKAETFDHGPVVD